MSLNICKEYQHHVPAIEAAFVMHFIVDKAPTIFPDFLTIYVEQSCQDCNDHGSLQHLFTVS